MPEWKKLRIHESSPAQRGISEKLSRESFAYTATHFYPDKPLGSFHNGYQNEDLLRQTFPDEFFDLVITLDVTEHVPDPEKMFKEIYRTLKPGGAYISTFPIHKRQIQPIDKRVSFDVEGELVYIKEPPEFHGNPIDLEGSLVWTDFGHDIHIEIAQLTGFDVEVTRFADALHGIIGEYTEVIVCWKREII
jgi:SAM-dependent methyltransferase